MPSFENYKNIKRVTPTPTGDAGVVLNDNFTALANSSITYSATDPASDWDSSSTANGGPFSVGSVVINTTTGDMWYCSDATPDSAVWNNTINMITGSGSGEAYQQINDSTLLVNRADTDEDSANNLITAISDAANLTPGNNALSKTNRATVIIPPGVYHTNTTIELSQSFVDLVAQFPQKGGKRLATDTDIYDELQGSTDLAEFRPPDTYIYCDVDAQTSTIKQSAADVRLVGFGIAQLTDVIDGNNICASLWISNTDPSDSVYDTLYLWSRRTGQASLQEVTYHSGDVAGTWRDCIANGAAWRMPRDGVSSFKANMTDCTAGSWSYGGGTEMSEVDQYFDDCTLIRCKAIGLYDGGSGTYQGSGFASFGGCSEWGAHINSNVTFIECEAGDNSFGLGRTVAGTFIRCRGGNACFAGYTSVVPSFEGYAEDCVGGFGCFGGNATPGYDGSELIRLKGELVRCVSEDSHGQWNIDGAIIRDCKLSIEENASNAGRPCLLLKDDGEADSGISKVTGSELISHSTGLSIQSDTQTSIIAINCSGNGNPKTDTSLSILGGGNIWYQTTGAELVLSNPEVIGCGVGTFTWDENGATSSAIEIPLPATLSNNDWLQANFLRIPGSAPSDLEVVSIYLNDGSDNKFAEYSPPPPAGEEDISFYNNGSDLESTVLQIDISSNSVFPFSGLTISGKNLSDFAGGTVRLVPEGATFPGETNSLTLKYNILIYKSR